MGEVIDLEQKRAERRARADLDALALIALLWIGGAVLAEILKARAARVA